MTRISALLTDLVMPPVESFSLSYHSAVAEAAMRPAKYIFTIYFQDLDMERPANANLYELIGKIVSSINHTDLRIHLELVLISSGQNMTNSQNINQAMI